MPRRIEFSPLKNASGVDSAETCRKDLFALHLQWLEKAGGRVHLVDGAKKEDAMVEISPLLSYGGEVNEFWCFQVHFCGRLSFPVPTLRF